VIERSIIGFPRAETSNSNDVLSD